MDVLGEVITYFSENPDRVIEAFTVHVRLSASALLIAVLLYIPLGILASQSKQIGPSIVAAVGAARVVPSLAVLFLLLPYMGTGFRPALVALILLAGPPIIVNTDAGLRNIDTAILENARGLGMTFFQAFSRVQFPLALPVVLAGVRAATVEIIASATLAAFIGAGGLGQFIITGLTLIDTTLLLVGAIPIIILAVGAEVLLRGATRLVTPPAQ